MVSKNFFEKYYLFVVSFPFILGIYGAFNADLNFYLLFAFFLYIGFFFYSIESKKIGIHSFIFFLIGFSQVFFHIQLPPKFFQEASGKAIVHFDSVSDQFSSFGQSIYYRGVIKRFYTQDHKLIAKNIPFSMNIPKKFPRINANKDYCLQRVTLRKRGSHYNLKWNRPFIQEPLAHTYSLAELRYKLKQQAVQRLVTFYSSSDVREFMKGMATGEFSNTFMIYTFSRMGLQHLLAISGFHFALIAVCISALFQFIFRGRIQVLWMLLCLTLYFFYMGKGPSIERAWIMAFCFWGCYFFKRVSLPLNALGLSAIIILFDSPFLIMHLGFQFSFLCTAAILLYFQPIDRLLSQLWKRVWGCSYHPIIKKCGIYLRQALALNMAVHIGVIPVILYYFHSFYVMSFFYNLVFPILFSISLLLLIIGLILGIIFEPISGWLHYINQYWTEKLLTIAYWLPRSSDLSYSCKFIPVSFLWVYLLFFLGLGSWFLVKNPYQKLTSISI